MNFEKVRTPFSQVDREECSRTPRSEWMFLSMKNHVKSLAGQNKG